MYHGSIVALVTPMNASGGVDFDTLAALVDWHIDQGTHALVAVGTTGESTTLDWEEHIAVIRHVVEIARHRVPVIAGTGANATREAVELTQAAKDVGADACLLVTPYYNRPTQIGLYRHYRTLAEAVAIPQILYNVPKRTGCDLLPATVAQLFDCPHIIGIKDASTAERLTELLALPRPDYFQIYTGDDPQALSAMSHGGAGVISVTANVAPKAMRDLAEAILHPTAEVDAAALDAQLQPLHAALMAESNPIPAKWALYLMGKIGPGIRLPLTPLSEEHREPLKQTLMQMGLL